MAKKSNLAVVSPTEAARLKSRIAEDESRKREAVQGPDDPIGVELGPSEGRRVNVHAMDRRISRRKKYVEAVDPANHRLTGNDRQSASKEMAELEPFFKANMLTAAEMSARPSADHRTHSAYLQAVKKSMAQEVGSKEFQKKAARYKYLARLLEPENPDLGNLERFRA
jgi:hypothetical protein